MDPTTKITLEDGTEVTVADLIQSRKDLARMVEINDDLQMDLEKVGHLFRAESTMDQRVDAIRSTLENLGYEEDQINEYIAQTQQKLQDPEPETEPEPEPETEEVELPDLPDENDDIEDSSGGSPEDDMSNEMTQQLQQELEAQRQELTKMRVKQLRENLNSQLDRVMDSNKELQKLLETSRTLRGDEGVAQAKQTLRAQLEQRALERMQARRTQAGTFEDSWMSEEVEKAAEPVLGTFRSVIGDIDKLGRSSETVTGFDAEEILRTKPAPEPEWKPGATVSDIESQVKSFASDTIKRAMAASPTESAI